MALLEATSRSEPFKKDRWRAQDVMALVEKTSVKPSEALIASSQRAWRERRCVFANGQSLRETVDVPKGMPSRHLSGA